MYFSDVNNLIIMDAEIHRVEGVEPATLLSSADCVQRWVAVEMEVA